MLQGVLNGRRVAMTKGLPKSNMDMMDRLIEAEDEHGKRLDDEDIIDILIMYLNAGHESSAHISMWATVFLQENPEIFAMAKVSKICFFSRSAICNSFFGRNEREMHPYMDAQFFC